MTAIAPKELEPFEQNVTTKPPVGLFAKTDCARLMEDIGNTSLKAAFIGGFSLGNLKPPSDNNNMELAIYILAFMAFHACTCSALTSAFIYRQLNHMEGSEVAEWASTRRNKIILKLPMIKFIMGTIMYMMSVILISWESLTQYKAWQALCLGIGIMGMSSVAIVALLLRGDEVAHRKLHQF